MFVPTRRRATDRDEVARARLGVLAQALGGGEAASGAGRPGERPGRWEPGGTGTAEDPVGARPAVRAVVRDARTEEPATRTEDEWVGPVPGEGASEPDSPGTPSGAASTFGSAPQRPESHRPAARLVRDRVGRLVEQWLPGGTRVDRGRPGAVALSVIAAVAAVVAATGVWLNRPVVEPAPTLPRVVSGQGAERLGDAGSGRASGRSTADPPGGTGTERGQIVVSVVGRVARPGLVTLPEGARVADAVQAAGGPVPGTDLASLNLARRLTGRPNAADPLPGFSPACAS